MGASDSQPVYTMIISLITVIFSCGFNDGVVALVMGTSPPAGPEKQFTALFAFGDSLTDNGNNNYFLSSLAKANYVPYGDLIGIPNLPAFANPSATGKNILRGVNYASAAAGILDETGQNLGQRFSLSQQVENFEKTLNQLRNNMNMSDEEISHYLSKALVVMTLGSNDYINNYLVPSMYPTSFMYNPKDYADLLIKRYARQILAMHGLGLRKFFFGGIGPLGCIPNQIATSLAPNGKCVSFVNDLVGMFNTRLRSLVDQLNTKHPEAIFVYGNTYGALGDILNNPTAYGFKVIDRGCCGVGRNEGQATCLPFSIPCRERNQYMFWDAFHPTQAVHQILAQRAYTGPPSDCYPINLQQMALL
ncbi:hypothetical protein RHGRI_029631 [Rhododendron griersonianum]|uniref:GDSL esterase/lipase n=1 Tax=Rhododendron griersonianum TaxID=479676 RepID=A0AAV6IMD5_9ERIC|nr:hypothetical protein RHGRI_029631 [Rhododendron griersonianum]